VARHWAKLGRDVRIANSRGPGTLTATGKNRVVVLARDKLSAQSRGGFSRLRRFAQEPLGPLLRKHGRLRNVKFLRRGTQDVLSLCYSDEVTKVPEFQCHSKYAGSAYRDKKHRLSQTRRVERIVAYDENGIPDQW